MANNVKKEFELYEPMRCWLQTYLEEKYQGATIITVDSHAQTLDLFLEKYGVIDNYPQTVGLDIQIDVLGNFVCACFRYDISDVLFYGNDAEGGRDI